LLPHLVRYRKMGVPERRRHKRIQCPCTVRIRPFKEGVDVGLSGRWDVVTLVDLSVSGILFTHTRSFLAGSMLEFNILSTPTSVPIYCIGRVIRSGKKPSSTTDAVQTSLYSTAVMFKSFDGGTLEAIKRICDAAEQKK